MDWIVINDFRCATRIGVYDWEREVEQQVLLDLEIAIPSSAAGRTDELSDALDYARVVDRVRRLLAEHDWHLLERLAEGIAELILSEFHAPAVRVRLAKIAPLAGIRTIAVRIERSQDETS
jgi:dihydroneopterin aldolase